MRLGFHAILVVLVLMYSVGCRNQGAGDSSPATQSDPPEVGGQLVKVEMQPWPTIVRVQGSLAADEVTSVAARVAGRVVKVHFDLGDSVACGETLVSLDPREFDLKLAQAEAQLAQARAAIGMLPDDRLEDLNPANAPPVREARAVLEEAQQQVQRIDVLFRQGAIVATDLETVQSLVSVAEARYNSAMNSVREKIALVQVQSALVELAQQELEDATIPAPFAGLVQNRTVAQGMYVQVGQTLMEIAKTDRLRYRASVPERYAQSLSLGQSVHLSVGGEQRLGRVERIAPTLDPLNRSLTFEAMVDNSDGWLRAGLFASAELVLDDQAKALVVQHSSLVRFAGVDKVWRVSEGQVQEAVVRLGRETENGVEILGGLQPGDRILQEAREGKRGSYVQSGPELPALVHESSTELTDFNRASPSGKNVSTCPEPQAVPAAPSEAEPRSPRT